jgi:hypothetical protein
LEFRLELVTQWQEKLDKLENPTGVSYIWGGDQNQSEGFGTLELHCSHHISLPSNGRVI